MKTQRGIILTDLLFILVIVCWAVNFIKLMQCDFEEPHTNEVIHAVGLFPFAAPITVWFGKE